jgi:hypothetical protein
MYGLNAGDRRCGTTEMLEAEHRTKPYLDRSMILLDQIIEVFGRSDLAPIAIAMFAENLPDRTM